MRMLSSTRAMCWMPAGGAVVEVLLKSGSWPSWERPCLPALFESSTTTTTKIRLLEPIVWNAPHAVLESSGVGV